MRSDDAENRRLISAYRAGDQSALDALIERSRPLVRWVVSCAYGRRRMLNWSAHKPDCVQEGFLAILDAADGFDVDGSASFVSYAATAVHRRVVRYIDKQMRTPGWRQSDVEDECEAESIVGDDGSCFDPEPMDVEVRRAVDSLPEMTGMAIRMRYGMSGDPMSYSAIGAALGVSREWARILCECGRVEVASRLGGTS